MSVDITFLPSSERLNLDGKANGYLNKLYFYGVKNEYESCQLIVNSSEGITNARLVASDISNGFSAIPQNAFEIYLESYTELTTGSILSIAYSAGMYPDALINQELDCRSVTTPKGIKAFWVTLKIPSECCAGNYYGKFQLIIDNEIIDVPVEIEVADYVLSDNSTMPTSYGIFADYIDPEYETNDELLEICFKEHYKYRLNPFLHFRKYPSCDRIVSLVDKFFDDPRFTGFGLPDLFGAERFEYRIDAFRDTILLLASRSTPNRNLLSKIYVYYFDEPEGNKIVDKVEDSFTYYRSMLESVLDEINADTTGAYDNFKKIRDYESYILKLKILSTPLLNTNSGLIQENTDILCPSYAEFTDREYVRRSKNIYMSKGKEIWWYGCSGPRYPFPTFHIADRLVTSRVVSWMQYSFGVIGSLYYRSYGIWANELGKVDNMKGEPFAFNKPFGDGFLFYYGSICNQKTPLPSIRLMSIRDGIEEFELLRALELKYDRYKEYFDSSFDSRKAVETICNKLFDDVYTKNDDKMFRHTRRELIEKLSDHYKIPYAVGSIEYRANRGNVSFYTVKDACVSIDGIELKKASNGVYSYGFDLHCGVTVLNVKICCNGETEEHIEIISDHIDYFDKITCRQCKEAFSVEHAQYKLDVCYSPVRTEAASKGVSIELKYSSDDNPEIYFDISTIDKALLQNANKISFKVYNCESRSLTIFETLCGEEKEVELEANELFPNRENTLNVEIEFLKPKIDFVPKQLKLVLRNTYPEDSGKDMRIVIDNVKICYTL